MDTDTKKNRFGLVAGALVDIAVGTLCAVGALLMVATLPLAIVYDSVSAFFDETCFKAYDINMMS